MKNNDEKSLIGSILNDEDLDYKIWSNHNTLSPRKKDVSFTFKEKPSSESNQTNEICKSLDNWSLSSETSSKPGQGPSKPKKSLKMLYEGSTRNPKRNNTLGIMQRQPEEDPGQQPGEQPEYGQPTQRNMGTQKKHRTMIPTQPTYEFIQAPIHPQSIINRTEVDCYHQEPDQYYDNQAHYLQSSNQGYYYPQQQISYQQPNYYQPQYQPQLYIQPPQQALGEINDDMLLSYELDQLCGNQILSRKIQKIYEFGRDDQREAIFNKIERQCLQTCKDIFGNYVVQKIFEKGPDRYRMKLFTRLRPSFYELSKNNFGCRVIQKLLEFIVPYEDMQDAFLQEVQPQVKTLIHDMYGNYVLLKCLETMRKEKLEFIIRPVEDSVQFMAQQTYGCRIIQKILELYTPAQTATVLRITMGMATQLCFCEYGNYIIQFILRMGPQAEQEVINQIIKDNFESLSINKYGSNSVEKFLENMSQDEMKDVINILLKQSSNSELIFYNLCINPYGNYVMRRFLIVCDKELLQPLMKALRSNLELIMRIRGSEYGQRVYQILEKLIVTA